MRLLSLNEKQAVYIISRHWDLVETFMIGYLEAQDMKDASNSAKIMQNYHRIALQLLTNFFFTETGRALVRKPEKGHALVKFCTYSLSSLSPQVVEAAAKCLYNYNLFYGSDRKPDALIELQKLTMKKFAEILSEKESAPALGKGDNHPGLLIILLSMCWTMYSNVPLCMWIEESFKMDFMKVNGHLKQVCQNQDV